MRVLAIGGGVTGCSFAHFVKKLSPAAPSVDVEVWNKARNLGGRAPRDPKTCLDWGLQYITRRRKSDVYQDETPAVTSLFESWKAKGMITPWTNIQNDPMAPLEAPEVREHWVATSGVPALCEDLLGDIVHRQLEVFAIRETAGGVEVHATQRGGAVIVEQVDVLFVTSSHILDAIKLENIERPEPVTYSKRFALIVETSQMPFTGEGCRYVDGDAAVRYIRWNDMAIVVHTSVDFAVARFGQDDAVVADEILAALTRHFEIEVTCYTLKRWKVSNAMGPFPDVSYRKLSNHVFLGGDAFGPAERRGVFHSAVANGEELAGVISEKIQVSKA